ncbi:molybdate ABC transporter substrate-binding protein [Sphingomonas sp. IC-56]|uniref:molybdate ABC transporter substrate-binding protein n=1 Tax=Sphingomonas sp. IC-56 TaxID=2898529 RepID=UPI001E2FF870|nr:molybdate ABC transporter substrate-binding protein [Sphingomonas sp. IC-56]MCD2325063.1 molybdate ABC transporter substrate-binding protein [Sphingomonas sp. IC-56]
MLVNRRSLLAGIGTLALARPARAAGSAPLVLAAASLQESMNAVADAWAGRGHARPVLSFAGSSALARQIVSGAPADLFLSADEPWMDYVAQRGLLVPGTRAPFLGNRLVVVQSAAAPRIAANIPLARVLRQGRIAMADVEAVPAGKYGKAALERLGLWARVSPRVVRAENVRAALALVERGAAEWGIVYATDARASQRVRAFRMFPAGSHPPIRYPLARLKTSRSPDAEPLRRFLLSSEGKAIFARFGFQPL